MPNPYRYGGPTKKIGVNPLIAEGLFLYSSLQTRTRQLTSEALDVKDVFCYLYYVTDNLEASKKRGEIIEKSLLTSSIDNLYATD